MNCFSDNAPIYQTDMFSLYVYNIQLNSFKVTSTNSQIPNYELFSAESDSDHEPSSTVTIPTPPHTVEGDDQASQSSESKPGETFFNLY